MSDAKPLQPVDTSLDADMEQAGASVTPSESQTENNDSQDKTVTPTDSEDDDSSNDSAAAGTDEGKDDSEDADEPFNKNPAFKARIGEIETKYGTKAKNWDSFAEILQEDPELALKVVEKYEAKGLVNKGTTDALKAKIEAEKKQKETAQAPLKNEEDTELEKAIQEHPDVKYARELREANDAKKKSDEEALGNWLMNHEKKHPEIEKSKNPELTRKTISSLAQLKMAQDGADFETAFEDATNEVLHPGEAQKQAEEDGEINGEIKSIQQSAGTFSGGGAAVGDKTPKLTPEERTAMDLAGFKDPKEYLKYQKGGEELWEWND